MISPPYAVRLVMEAVCVIKGIKPERVPDPSTGRRVEDYWKPSLLLLGNMKFLESLVSFDKVRRCTTVNNNNELLRAYWVGD